MGLSSDDMQDILIDACGWIAVVEANINIDIALNQILGPHQFWLIPQVKEEIKRLSHDKKKRIFLDLLMAKSNPFIDETIQFTHTDDVLHAISLQRRWPILTVDTKLKRRLSESGLPWIEVKGKKHLAVIETYGSVNKSSSP
ncbi:MAG TPA: hypothetical protein D7H86_06615 [Candidatus Poseidoniales archaeon]|jgi:rRNA-processing protein FCF1|nr:hypothetical protein [Euryarchaeota archaeon]DAC12021.1 MAG TPA: hypothetical protein D7H86_06615 [Candidatus Poseidoniales archaeon]|tara:strand:+ start:1262 stop:1687 length:426 start_codon:yes stop_codon:yes gene_type:complete